MNDKMTTPKVQPTESELAPEQLDEKTRSKKQLEILDHFGTIDFDPD